MLGAVATLVEGTLILAIVAAIVGIFAIVAYQGSRQHDPGMTTEIALVLTCLLGGLAMQKPVLAAGIGTALAVLLAAKNRLHNFVSGVLTERELHDALLFLAASLILLPLVPDKLMGPFDAINPREVASLIVLVMGISAVGYIAMRSLGPRYGLPLAGFAAGFVSSTATIYSMGDRAERNPGQVKAATAGAVLSSVATILQMAFIVGVIHPPLLHLLWLPLVLGGFSAASYGLLFTRRAVFAETQDQADIGHAFDLKSAIIFATIISLVLLLSAGINSWLGPQGLAISTGITGLVDAHATAASVASLTHAGKLGIEQAIWPVLIGLTTNSLMKIVVAIKAGGTSYAWRVAPGVVLMTIAVWVGALI
jgi:uncharacterized membrane protein (DUF4010 family)